MDIASDEEDSEDHNPDVPMSVILSISEDVSVQSQNGKADTGNHGDQRSNGTREPIRKKKKDRRKESEAGKETLLQRNKGEWMIVTQKIDQYFFIFTVIVTVIIGLVVAIMTTATNNSLVT